MRRSSIFSFNTFQAKIRLSYWSLIFIGFVLITEFLLRQPAVTHHLPDPEPTLWHAELIPAKVAYLKAFAATHGVDVLLIGNSTMQAGVDPQFFDQSRGKTESRGAGAFNAAIEGLPPYGNLMFLNIYLRYAHPKTIIYGITPQDLNANSPWAKDVTDRVTHSPAALAESGWGLRGKLIAAALDHSALYRYRFVLHRLLLRGGTFPAVADVYFDERGYDQLERRLSDFSPESRGMFYNRAGVINYSTAGKQTDALRTFIEYTQANNIEIILVNMPLADEYYNNFDSAADYQDYLTTLTQLAAEYQIPLWDMENLAQTEGFNDTHFADFNHLNGAGAEKLTKMLARQYTDLIAISAN